MGLRLGDLAVLGPDVIGTDPAAAEAMLLSDEEMQPFMKRFAGSKALAGRTSYEVQYARSFLQLARVGLQLDADAYLYDYAVPVLRL